MSPEESLQNLAQFVQEAEHLNVLLVAKDEPRDNFIIQRLNLHEDLTVEFRKTIAKNLPVNVDEIILREYDPGYKLESHELGYIKLENNSSVLSIVQDVSQIGRAELFAEVDEIIDNLRFYVVAAGDQRGRQAVFFRTYSPKKELARRNGFAVMLRRGQYNKINQKIFLFDDEVDCFAWDGFLFIKSVHHFHIIFRYFDELRANAAQTVDAVTGHVPINNLTEFKAACTSQLQMMMKLANLAKKPYLQRVTMDDIKRTIAEFKLDIQTVCQNGTEELVFDSSPKKRWIILKLLDDDYLGSVMTREKYETNSKRRMV